MSTEEQKEFQAQGLKRLLDAIEKIAKDASLTGMLNGGEAHCIRQFNTALAQMQAAGTIPEGLFEPLAEGSCYGDIGVAASLLSAYLGDPKQEFKIQLEQLPHALHQHVKDGKLNKEIQVQVQKAFKQAGRELRDLGVLVRESMPDFLEHVVVPESGHTEHVVVSEDEHDKYDAQHDEAEAKETDESRLELDRQIQELHEQMTALGNQMQESGISPEQMQELAQKMQKLVQKQVELMSK